MKALIALLGLCSMITACSVDNGSSGPPKAIPTIMMTCQASACLTGASMFSRMYITALTCSEGSIDNSIAASSSENVSCSNAGCTQTFGNWVNMTGGSVSTVPQNTYNLCGVVANSYFAPGASWSGNVVAVGHLGGVNIDGTTNATIDVTDWADGTIFPQ